MRITWSEDRRCNKWQFPDGYIVIFKRLQTIYNVPRHNSIKTRISAFDVKIGIGKKRYAVLEIFSTEPAPNLIGDTANIICIIEDTAIVRSQRQLERIGVRASNLRQIAEDIALKIERNTAGN